MKRKILSVLLTFVLVLSFSLVTAVPVSADVTSATVGVVPTTAGEADAEYTITFSVGNLGALATAEDDTIVIVFYDGTVVPEGVGIAGTVNDIAIVTATGVAATRTATITTPVDVANDEQVIVVLTAGITNPGAGHCTLTVATNEEPAAIESQTYTIEPLETAIADAEAALTASAAAKTAHIAAGGDAADRVAVETAEGDLDTALAATPAVTADIVAATTALGLVVGDLEAATALLVAITNGNTALAASGLAKAAHIAAGGDAADRVAVETAEGSLEALLLTGLDTTGIVSATTTLTGLVGTLEDATALLEAIIAGDAALVLSLEAKDAYIVAGGAAAVGDAVYTEVEAAEATLTTELDGGAGTDTVAIVAATTALNDLVVTLVAATEDLVAAIGLADAALLLSEAAKATHIAGGGKVTIAAYLAVLTAEDVLIAALAADPRVTGTITAATGTLNGVVATLETATSDLAEAITTANTALADSITAKATHIAAEGLAADNEYEAVAAEEDLLIAALAAVPLVEGDIEAATTNLDDAVLLLVAATEAITDGNAALVLSGEAKDAYIAAAGAAAVDDVVYTNVEDEEGDLETLLATDPKDTTAIGTAITDLGTVVVTLVAATEDLVAAIVLAETAQADSITAKDAHIAAEGLAEDAEYLAVVTAEIVLADALAEDPLVEGDIETATGTLSTLVGLLEDATGVLELDAAIVAGNAALDSVADALLAHTDAGGDELDAEYVAVEDADTALDDALGAGPPVTADVVAATTALNDAVTDLEAVTGLWTTYDMLLTLNEGWTLISTDKSIVSETSAWEGDATLKFRYNGVAFVEADFADLRPVEALYVKMPLGGWAGFNYLAAAPGMSSIELIEGWNLISSGTVALASGVLSPLQDIGNQGMGLTTLVSQSEYNRTISWVGGTNDWYIDATTWQSVIDAGSMDPFDGYWIYMNAPKIFGVIL